MVNYIKKSAYYVTWIKGTPVFTRKTIVCIFSLFFSISTYAQETEFNIRISYNTYQLNDLSHLLKISEEELQSNGLDARIVNSYPPYLAFQLNISVPVMDASPENPQPHKLGAFLGFSSTGGRIHNGDYSGDFAIDHLINRITLGGELKLHRLI